MGGWLCAWKKRDKLLPLLLNILVRVLSSPCSKGCWKHRMRSIYRGGNYLVHGVPVVKSTLCCVRVGPTLACTWISPKADLCPHREQEPSNSRVLPYTKTCKTGGRHVLGMCSCSGSYLNHMFRYWGSLEKCPLWLLLLSPQIHPDQLLVVYPFIDLAAL